MSKNKTTEDWIKEFGVRVKKGDNVKFIGEYHMEFPLEKALKVLKVGEVYTIDFLFVDMWGVYYHLVEVPNKSFPEDMFEVI